MTLCAAAAQVVPESELEKYFGHTDLQEANAKNSETTYLLFYQVGPRPRPASDDVQALTLAETQGQGLCGAATVKRHALVNGPTILSFRIARTPRIKW